MTINEAVIAIEKLLESKAGIVSAQVRPSGDDVDVIKIWIDLGASTLDADVWAKSLDTEIRRQLPDTLPYRLEIRAETD